MGGSEGGSVEGVGGVVEIYNEKIPTSTNSCVSLNGEFSKPKFLPGEIEKMNPKSMWMMWPSESKRILPLCLCGNQDEKRNT